MIKLLTNELLLLLLLTCTVWLASACPCCDFFSFVCFKINRSHWSGPIAKCSVSGMDLKRHYPFFFFVTKMEIRPWPGPVVFCFIQVMSSGSQTPGLVPLPASFKPCSDFRWSAETPTVTFFHCQTSVCLLFCCLFARGLWVKDLFRLFVIWTYSISLCFINLNLPSKSQKEQSNFENFNWPLQVQKGENQITEPLSAGDIPHRYKAWDGNVQVFVLLISAVCTFGTGWAQGWLRAASQLVWLVGAQICSPEERHCAGRHLDARPWWCPQGGPFPRGLSLSSPKSLDCRQQWKRETGI